MKVLAVDPGLDAAGLALFEFDEFDPRFRGFVTFQGAVEAVTDLRVIRTEPDTPMPQRLAMLHNQLSSYCQVHRPKVVVLEEPALAAAYAERRGRQRGRQMINAEGMSRFHQAFGALQAAAHTEVGCYEWGDGFGQVTRWPAKRIQKPKRRHIVRLAGQHAPAGNPVATLIGKLRGSPDLFDAIYLGADAIAAGVLRRRSA